MTHVYSVLAAFILVLALTASSQADLLVTEAYPGAPGSEEGTNDWFELYNPGPGSLSVTGLYYDDDHADPTANTPVELLGGLTELQPGEVLLVLIDTGGNAAPEIEEFETFWGISGLNYGYIEDGHGLGGGDVVNLYDGNTAGANLVASFDYGGVDVGYRTAVLDLSSNTAQAAVVGQLGAFSSVGLAGDDDLPIVGSPGYAIPEPATLALLALALAGVAARRK